MKINRVDAMEWFEELKRRGVYKATAVYTVVAWSLLQAIDIIAPPLMRHSGLIKPHISPSGWLSSSTDFELDV